jgi:hypothetical protein
MKERAHKRVPVHYRTHVWDEIEESLLGQLCNVSAGGLLLLSEQKLPMDAIYQIRIEPADSTAFEPFSLGAETLWMQPGNQGASFWIGMRVIGASEEGRKRLAALVSMAEV